MHIPFIIIAFGNNFMVVDMEMTSLFVQHLSPDAEFIPKGSLRTKPSPRKSLWLRFKDWSPFDNRNQILVNRMQQV